MDMKEIKESEAEEGSGGRIGINKGKGIQEDGRYKRLLCSRN